MSAASRAKGVRGEREVAKRFEDAGWTVRGLEGGGDHFVTSSGGMPPEGFTHASGCKPVMLHIEAKRQERLRLPEWLEQAASEAPPGLTPVVVFRQSRRGWYACLPLDDLLGMLG